MDKNPLRFTKSTGCKHQICQTCGGYIPFLSVSGMEVNSVCSGKCLSASRDQCSCKCGGLFHGGQNSNWLTKILDGDKDAIRRYNYARNEMFEEAKNRRRATVGAYPDLSEYTAPALAGKYVKSEDTVKEINLVFRKGQVFEADVVTSSKTAVSALRKAIGRRLNVQEVFIALYLDRRNVPIGYTIHSLGGVAGTVVDAKMIAATAAKTLASGVIVAHNHPSGNLTPSSADIAISNKLKDGLKFLDIFLLDSLIITEEGYYSLADNGQI